MNSKAFAREPLAMCILMLHHQSKNIYLEGEERFSGVSKDLIPSTNDHCSLFTVVIIFLV